MSLKVTVQYQCDVTGQSYAQIITLRSPDEPFEFPKPPAGWEMGPDGTVLSPTIAYSTGGTYPSITTNGKIVTYRPGADLMTSDSPEAV